jgi:hypothetical protein
MLSRRGGRQVPYEFPTSSPRASYDRKEKRRRANKRRANKRRASKRNEGLCLFCENHVFTAALHEGLVDARDRRLGEYEISYSRNASHFHTSILQGCRWCTSIGNAVLMSGHLDDILLPRNRYDDKYHTASADDLDCGATLNVRVTFLKTNAPETFDQLKVYIEVIPDDHGDDTCLLREMRGEEEEVRLIFEMIDSPGKSLSLSVLGICYNELTSNGATEESKETVEPAIFPRRSAIPKEWMGIWLPKALEWLKTCKDCHEACANSENTFRPTRLIEVNGAPKIVSHQDGSQYVALSYVWGFNQTYTLTEDTMDKKFVALDQMELPKTILDAIDVARRLGYGFLWVDALCIIQDSQADKEREIPLMRDIYRNSALTIVAANAESAAEGFLRVPEEPDYYIQPFTIPFARVGGKTVLRLGFRSDYKPWKDPINNRAWTLQERILSTRALFFSYDGIKWLCKQSQINPSAPLDAPPPFPILLKEDTIAQNSELSYRKAWLDVREEYNRRKLTNASDKFLAISAIVNEIARCTGWQYISGLWRDHVFLDLHWHRHPVNISEKLQSTTSDPLLPRTKSCMAPTWSWASASGGVIGAEIDTSPRVEFHFRIVSIGSSAPEIGTPYSAKQTGNILVVEGRIIELVWREAGPDDLTDGFILDNSIQESWKRIVGTGTRDVADANVYSGCRVWCLAMSLVKSESRYEGPSYIEGLILLPRLGRMTFERVGFFRIDGSKIFDNVKEVELRII